MCRILRCFFAALILLSTSAASAGIFLTPQTEHVWVVFKTHFDIGYTARVADVLARYRGPMVDNAMAVIAKNRAVPSGQRFSWTIPGWPLARIIDDRQTPDRRAKVIEALKEGSLAVHALPFSMHTESLDIEDLVRGLHFSSQIARDLGKPLPIGAKMTDVPSHSWILPTLLHHAGIRFLHLGCNGGSQYPRVPPLFWWEGPDGSRILCAYAPDYGSPPTPRLQPPSSDRNWPAKNYLAMIMEGDNHGPPTAEEVESVRRTIATQLPKAKVTFGTLDDFAKAIEEEKPELEVIRGDMPDTWIHGLMSNPIENQWNTNFRFWQEGSWSERVKLWPLSKSDNSAENLAINSWEARLPLLVATAKGPAGTLPVSQTGLSLSRPGVLVTAFGDDPDGTPGTLLRVWEQAGKSGDLVVTLPDGLKATQATPVNLRGERTGTSIPIKDGKLNFDLPAFAPASFILTP